MHTILLLYRSVVLAAATPDASAGSDGGGGGGGGGAGGGETTLDFDFAIQDHTVAPHGTTRANAETAEITSPHLLQAQPSVSGDIEWVAAQTRADDEAAAAAAKREMNNSSEIGLERVGDAEVGDCGIEFHGGSAGCGGAKDFRPEQVQSAQYIAGQLDTEVR